MIAGLVLVALIVQVWVAIDVPSQPPGHAVGTLEGTNLGGRLLRLISFFTIESNIVCGVVSAQLVARPDRDGRGWRVVRLAALFGITVTGVVYSTVLAGVHTPHGWRETTTNTIVHYVVPIMMVIGWLLFGPRPRIGVATVLWALAWPVLWLCYTLVLGATSGWYPYPFLDVTTHGYGRVLLNALAVTAVFAALCALYGFGDRKLPRRPVAVS